MRHLALFPPDWGMARQWSDFFDGWPFPAFNRLMATDVRETEGEYHLTMDLPGVNKQDVQIEVKDNVLHVVAERRAETDTSAKDGSYLYRERHYGRQERSFTLPGGVDPEGIKATFDRGQLEIILPKKNRHPGRRIEIQ
ncbi:MAG: Hsp20/alpha crystallin family protein [Betaproteobacteria bacterium]